MSDELIAEAELGDQAKAFLESDLGRCLIGLAQQEVWSAHEALESISPTDIEGIRSLQSQAKMGRMFEQWLIELIDKGESALEVLREQTN